MPSVSHKSVGASVEFKCQAAGSPRPRIRWTKQGGNLPDQHQTLDGTLV